MEQFAIEQLAEITHLEPSDERAKDLLYVLNESSIVVFTDVAGIITYVKDKFSEISEYSGEALVGENHRVISFWNIVGSE